MEISWDLNTRLIYFNLSVFTAQNKLNIRQLLLFDFWVLFTTLRTVSSAVRGGIRCFMLGQPERKRGRGRELATEPAVWYRQ